MLPMLDEHQQGLRLRWLACPVHPPLKRAPRPGITPRPGLPSRGESGVEGQPLDGSSFLAGDSLVRRFRAKPVNALLHLHGMA